jgi:hypothetical protein
VLLHVLSSQQSCGVLQGSPERLQSAAPPVPAGAPLAPAAPPAPGPPAMPSTPPFANDMPPAAFAPPTPPGGPLPSLPQELARTATRMRSGRSVRETFSVRRVCVSIESCRGRTMDVHGKSRWREVIEQMARGDWSEVTLCPRSNRPALDRRFRLTDFSRTPRSRRRHRENEPSKSLYRRLEALSGGAMTRKAIA